MNSELPDGALVAPGWTGDWIVGWLAALGVSARTDLRVSFTREPVPKAVFSHPDRVVTVDDIVSALFSEDELNQMAIARPAVDGRLKLDLNPSIEAYSNRAALARKSGDLGLGAVVTDLLGDGIGRSPFNPGAPGGETLWDRAATCRGLVVNPEVAVADSIAGVPQLSQGNGLGFDPRRISVRTVPKAGGKRVMLIDPVAELLALAGLPFIPVRGTGRKGDSERTRGWTGHELRRGTFVWPVWCHPLSGAAVDALLDEFWSTRWAERDQRSRRNLARLDVFGVFGSVPFGPTGAMDPTRGISSVELWMQLSR